MPRFDGKVALITGAASGIGKEIALRFAARGGIPIVADLNLDAADATAREIRSKGSDAAAVAMTLPTNGRSKAASPTRSQNTAASMC